MGDHKYKPKARVAATQFHLCANARALGSLTVTSSRSGRKRSAEVGWDQIINTLIHDHDQRGKISSCVGLDLTTPADFLASRRKAEFTELIGMEGWKDQLTECVANVSAIL